jgi:long-chain acyl-CoA synthetase
VLLHHFLEDSASRYPDKTALICGDRRITYAQLDRGANALAQAFHAQGLARQSRVCIYYENSVETVMGVFAAMKAAGIFVVVNPATKAAKLGGILNDCSAHILVTGWRDLAAVEAAVAQCPDLQHVILADGPNGKDPRITFSALTAAGKSVHRLSDLVAAHPHVSPACRANIDLDLASLIYTSGSTGIPKGVMLTHLNMVMAATSITAYLRNESDDIILSCLPLAFDYGLYQVLMAFKFGGTVVLEKAFTYPGRYLDLMVRENVTGLPIVPTILAILLSRREQDQRSFPTVRYLTNTAQALPVHYIPRLRKLFPKARIYSMYGLTECKRVSYLPPELIDQKPASVGIAIPNTEVWIEDESGKRITKPRQSGELVVRGAHIMAGYWNKPEETARCLQPGPYGGERVLRTGDLFQQDEDGYLYFVSRKDDLIKTAGERVSPREVENAIYELEPVKEVAVIGVADEILGSAIKAFVSLRAGMDLSIAEIVGHCRTRLESFMVPKYLEVLPELPKTNTGKISKKELTVIQLPSASQSTTDLGLTEIRGS